MRSQDAPRQILSPLLRIRLWYALLLLLGCIFIIRLFYLQVIRHDYYQKAALQKQLKEYEIPAARGVIEAHSGEGYVPIVLNEIKYTLFADPKFVTKPEEAAKAISLIAGGNAADYEKLIRTPDTRYVILAKKLNKEQKQKVDDLKLKGIGTREISYRTYPQGTLAAQLLGFVNDEGQGKSGIEQALDNELRGVAGELKAITDAQGVPLAANKDNLIREPVQGQRIVLTIDIGMQQRLEEILKQGLDKAQSTSGTALILDARNGKVKAMANYPTYNPAEYFKVEDGNVFNNAAVSAPLEVGSIMKPLTAAAALDLGVVSRDSSYFDPGIFRIDDARVTNIEEVVGAGTRTVQDILQLSLNTGATWLLMQMGGGEINEKARMTWYDYMTNHYGFGKKTGIEQGYEEPGYIPSPTEGFGLDIQYANTSFGQGMSATPMQMAAALASVVNGGTYYKPHLIEKTIDGNGHEKVREPQVVRKDVVSPAVGKTIQEFMEFVVQKNNRPAFREGYSVGGKTGTAQIPRPEGGYYDDRFNGMYLGFVGGNEAEYIIVVRVNEPKIAGYAGARAAGPIFADLTNMLVDNFGVSPKR
jgi:cell division protein FtsI (penicillin-binding protein 3)